MSSATLKPGSAQSTPSRDRNPTYRSDLSMSQTASPSAARVAQSSSSNTLPNGASPAMAPISVSALLAANSSAADPRMAALESAVTDRNVLAGQNAQLWKLIEKQRAGYTQIIKELERVRGERELYRSRLQSSGENTDALLKGHREKEKREAKESGLRSATSHAHLKNGESVGHAGVEARQQVQRAHSDDIAPQRQVNGVNAVDPSSRPHARERQGSQNSLNISISTSLLSSNYLSASQASSSTQLAVSPSETSSAASSSTHLPAVSPVTDTRRPLPLSLNSARPSPLPSGFDGVFSAYAQGDSLKTATTAAEIGWNVPHSAVPSRPANTPLTGIPPSESIPTPENNPPDTSRPADSRELSSPDSPTMSTRGHPMLQPQVIVQSASGSTSHASAGPHDGMDVSSLPSVSSGVTRGSPISLPEEAKRYYATMGDSPASSPRAAHGFPPARAGSSSPDKRHGVINGKRSESPLKQSNGAPTEPPNGRSDSQARTSEFLDMNGDDTDSNYDSVNESGRVSAVDSIDPDDGDDSNAEFDPNFVRKERKRATVEDFPLPPGTPPVHLGTDVFAQAQLQSPAPAQSQSAARSQQDTMSETADGNRTHHHVNGLSDAHVAPPQSLPQPSMSQVPPPSPFSSQPPAQPTYRALPLLPQDLPRTTIQVSHSSIRPNDRGKDVLSFVIVVDPGNGKGTWKVEKLYSDVLTLDARVRAAIGKTMGKRLVSLPEGRLWKDHAPAKVDQRKAALEQYLRSLIALPTKNKDEVIAFFTSGIASEAQKPVSRAGYKEGYLTKRGKNFGGWKTRYFVLQGPSLEYYESRGGTHLGSIQITGAQIGRQQRTLDRKESDEDNEYRHAFLIIEAKRGPGGSNPRHVLCAESDDERDSWVEILVRYVTGRYSDDDDVQGNPVDSRASTSSEAPSDSFATPDRRPARNVEIAKGPAVPISQLPPDASNAKLFQATPAPDDSPVKSGSVHNQEIPSLSSSLPTASPLVGEDDPDAFANVGQRANSEMGHYADLVDQRGGLGKGRPAAASPEQKRKERRRSMNPLKTTPIPEMRASSPEKDPVLQTPRVDVNGKVKISGPMNGTPIPAGYKFGGKDAPSEQSSSDRREKAKSRSFWGFGRQHDKPNAPVHVPRAVFGVSLEESLDVAEIASLPAIVFRCIQYLEAKKADQEEGIYRLSGSSAVIKALKDRFNNEGDVDLLGSDEHWDPHAIAGLLKSFLRELPASILTRDLHLRFLSVIDFVDPQERITELSQLIAALPIANYSLLRALTAHLILIVQNAHVNKMTMRNVGIVFSPTLGIPAGVFSLMLGEFKRVFNVDGDLEEEGQPAGQGEDAEKAQFSRRNSKRYSDAAADELLGLSGRTLTAAEASDEGEEYSVHDESGTEGTGEAENESIAESSATHSSAYAPSQAGQGDLLHPSDYSTPSTPKSSKASAVAANRGLNITVTDKASRRQSRMMGLPVSPRPPGGSFPNSPHTPPRPPASPSAAPPSPMPAPR